ncbi:Uncharacterised protein [Vibrio cholerae]|nr:Uncharacterised protein [Vibrio cholerae]
MALPLSLQNGVVIGSTHDGISSRALNACCI